MTMSKFKAAMKKTKMKKLLQKIKKFQKNSDEDGSITDDDIDILEDEFIGNIIDNQYVIIKYIGRGTFSRVWLLFDFENSKFVVFKVYFPKEKDEFQYELAALNRIKDKNFEHNIVFDSYLKINFENNDDQEHNNNINPCLILPYMGLSLSDIMDKKKVLSISELKYVTRQLLLSLRELHSIKTVHTDLKLDNILSNYHSQKNIDFINWFNSLNIKEQYNKLFVMNTPEDFNNFNRNKKKLHKRKIKSRTLKAVGIYLKKKITDYLNNEFINDNYQNDDQTNEINSNESGSESESESGSESDHESGSESDHESGSGSESDTESEINIFDLKFTLTDYSNALHIDEIHEDDELQIRAYRSPENIMGFKYNYKSELWAIGCLMWDLMTEKYIFEPELNGQSVDRDREQLSLMERFLGRFPKDMSLDCDRSYDLFEESGRIKKFRKVEKYSLEDELKDIRNDLTDEQISDLCKFLRLIWCYNPKQRISVDEALNHTFLN